MMSKEIIFIRHFLYPKQIRANHSVILRILIPSLVIIQWIKYYVALIIIFWKHEILILLHGK